MQQNKPILYVTHSKIEIKLKKKKKWATYYISFSFNLM